MGIRVFALMAVAAGAFGQASGPEAKEIPVPRIEAPMGRLPGAAQLPVRKSLPEVLVMNDGTLVTTERQWRNRREEIKRTLEYYAVGQMPPAPGNVRGREVRSELLLDGAVQYRLVELTFGPQRKLSLNVGVFTPAKGGPFPAIILMSGTPPGATPLERLPQGPNQGKGENVLLLVGPAPAPGANAPARPPVTAQALATQHSDVFKRGYALVTFNPNDCAEDTTLRNLDGSWAFRNTRFYPAYPGYDWGILGGWAWGASRVADFLEKEKSIDRMRMIVTGASRNGKAAMIAAAFDERLMGAPVVTGGGGVGAYRFAGPRRSETLDIMQTKYPNWFSPNMHEFRGQVEKLPFDQHWFLALAAPKPFIALEGITDTISLPEAVRQTVLGAEPAYELFGAKGRIGVNYARHGHAFTAEDWTAMMDFFDFHLRGRKGDRRFDRFPNEAELDAAALRERALGTLRKTLPAERYLSHSQAVEQIMRAFAAAAGGANADEWGLAGLLHDINIGTTSADLARHGLEGSRMARDLGASEAVVYAVSAHDDRPGVPRKSRLDHALYCADQVYWLMSAMGLLSSKDPIDESKAAAAWEAMSQVPSKAAVIGKVKDECGLMGLTMPKTIHAAHSAVRAQ